MKLRMLFCKMGVAAELMACSAMALAAANFPALSTPAVQVKNPERQVMQAIAFAGPRWVAVGERGLIVLSDDHGKTWRQAKGVPVSSTLTAIAFSGSKNGYAVGHGAVVLQTHDGGETWVKLTDGVALAKIAMDGVEEDASLPEQKRASLVKSAQQLVSDGPDKPLLDVLFKDENHGWIVGAYNLAFATEDGGKTWKSIGNRLDNPKSLHLYAIKSQAEKLWIVGEQGQLHLSLDNGKTFKAISSPYKGSWFTADFLPNGSLVVGGLRGNIFQTRDDGKTWSEIKGGVPASVLTVRQFEGQTFAYLNQSGQILVGTDDGQSVPLKLPPLPPLTSFVFTRDGFLVGTSLAGVVVIPTRMRKGDEK